MGVGVAAAFILPAMIAVAWHRRSGTIQFSENVTLRRRPPPDASTPSLVGKVLRWWRSRGKDGKVSGRVASRRGGRRHETNWKCTKCSLLWKLAARYEAGTGPIQIRQCHTESAGGIECHRSRWKLIIEEIASWALGLSNGRTLCPWTQHDGCPLLLGERQR